MKLRFHIIKIFIALMATPLLTGCIAVKMDSTFGSLLDTKKIDHIEIGVTKFSEILEWFGPPDYIIDGTQQIFDYSSMDAAVYGSISTRTMTSPEGMVILIYMISSPYSVNLKGIAVGGALMKMEQEVRTNELFIFISKKNRAVEFVIAGNDAG